MSISTALQGLDIYMRTTDETGAVTFSQHRVWDVQRFVRARQDEAAKLNERKGSTKAGAQQVTREQYVARSL
ncbi:hypothetical protein ABXN37_19675 [Piscinibacter sakaiensis]|uniref:Uncharacterized protein n=1 Tax=Piscinibacter sakaiensis TaxID=1547922 RepID=A0A0K8P428_PISS1|nr:hypothetical protein [Piscinibacter sakaiensis]GAP37346.1 hypothetical protein ISF6_3201 [Piscinibacter sakaiensis]